MPTARGRLSRGDPAAISRSSAPRCSRRCSSACRSASRVYRRAHLRRPVFAVLNVIQTIPSIALFGLLIAPLAPAWSRSCRCSAARHRRHRRRAGRRRADALFAAADRAQHRGGPEQVPTAVVDAATGMGMTPRPDLPPGRGAAGPARVPRRPAGDAACRPSA